MLNKASTAAGGLKKYFEIIHVRFSVLQCVDEECSSDVCALQDHADPWLSSGRGCQVKVCCPTLHMYTNKLSHVGWGIFFLDVAAVIVQYCFKKSTRLYLQWLQ